jgi:hypothetical protein
MTSRDRAVQVRSACDLSGIGQSMAYRGCFSFLALAAAAYFSLSFPQHADGAHGINGNVAVVQAVRTTETISIDGELQEAIWGETPVASGFRQRDPLEGNPASERTEVRIAYDDNALYVALRMYDSEPQKITRRLSRRDANPDADRIIVYLDPRHDHLTGAQFEVSAAGVQADSVLYDDTRDDDTWDAVWESAVSIDGEGWTVEIRIPFSQLRFNRGDQAWGFNVSRHIRRKNETAWLELVPKKDRGKVSRMAHLEGISGIDPPRHFELLPYVASRGEFVQPSSPGDPFNNGSRYFGGVGLDVKWSLGGTLTLDGTVNPDFGQVEQDPEVINLSAFETFYSEKRPFFIEGAQIFQYGRGGGGGSAPQIFYSRRIGRAPRGRVSAEFVDLPNASTILGAAKLTGKTPGGWSIGLLQAVTGRGYARYVDEGIRARAEVEPLANYLVARLQREVGRGGVGVLGTTVLRDLRDESLAEIVPRRAFAFGTDAYFFIDQRREWLLSGQLSGSHVQGSPEAVSRLQRSSARYFQRPDAIHLRLDEGRTSLEGWSGNLSAGRQSGSVRASASLYAISPGFEVNDLGYQSRSDRFGSSSSVSWRQFNPDRATRSRNVSLTRTWSWNFNSENQGAEWDLDLGATFLNYWSVGGEVKLAPETMDDRLTRGGPSTMEPGYSRVTARFSTDSRQRVSLGARTTQSSNQAGGWSSSVGGSVDYKASERLTLSLGPNYSRSLNIAQYVRSVEDSTALETYGRRYVFAELEQTQFSVQGRMNLILSPRMSLQMYSQPLLAVGQYGGMKELVRPHTFLFTQYGTDAGSVAYDAADRAYVVDPDGDGPAAPFSINNPDFNRKSLRLQTVFRWEWRLGSTLYVVWNQQRRDYDHPGWFSARRDARLLFGAPADDVFVVKIAYWLGR